MWIVLYFLLPSVDSSTTTSRELVRMMKVPVDVYDDPLTILKLEHYAQVHELFDYQGRKTLALHITLAIVEKEAHIVTADDVRIMSCIVTSLHC